jgi:glycosyltransferase involved in cell wall biosynthesis
MPDGLTKVGHQEPLVSVIIPCYNSEDTIQECVESILTQEYRNLECLIIDDGSKDGTWTLLLEQAKDKRVRLLCHEGHSNRGVAATRNLGIDASRGKLLAFLDADDAWLPNKLTLQMDAMRQAPDQVGVVFSDFYICEFPDPSIPMIEQSLRRSERFADIEKKFPGEPGTTAETFLFDPPNRLFNWIQSPTPLIRRELFDRGFRFIGPPRLTVQFEDYLMWLTLAFHCEFIALPEPLAIYRIHNDQYTTQFHQKGDMTKYWIGIEQVIDYLCESCIEEIEHRGLRRRVHEKFATMAVQSVEHADSAVLSHLLCVSLRKGFLIQFFRAYLVRVLNRCHYQIRRTRCFRMCHPFLRRMKHRLGSSRFSE